MIVVEQLNHKFLVYEIIFILNEKLKDNKRKVSKSNLLWKKYLREEEKPMTKN